MLEFLNACESFTLVFTKITQHRTMSTEKKKQKDAVINPCHGVVW